MSDDSAHVVNSWSHEQQCVPQVFIFYILVLFHGFLAVIQDIFIGKIHYVVGAVASWLVH